MIARSYLRCFLGLLTGLWVTTGAAVPIGFLLLTLIKGSNEGRLGPELLSEPAVVTVLLGGYLVAAAIGGWAAGWVTIERKWRLMVLLSLSHVGTWMVALGADAVPFPGWFAWSLAAVAVAGTVAGIGARVWQVRGRTRAAGTDASG